MLSFRTSTPFKSPSRKPSPRPTPDASSGLLRRHGDLRDDDADQRHHAADGEIDIAGDQQRGCAEHGDQDRRRVDADDDEILEPEERRVKQRENDDQRDGDKRQPDAARRFAGRFVPGSRDESQPGRAAIAGRSAARFRVQFLPRPRKCDRPIQRKLKPAGLTALETSALLLGLGRPGKFTYWSRVS